MSASLRRLWVVSRGDSQSEIFDVGASSVVSWVQRFRATGTVTAKPMGRDHRSGLERGWLLERIAAEPDLTLEELRDELKARGFIVGYGTV